MKLKCFGLAVLLAAVACSCAMAATGVAVIKPTKERSKVSGNVSFKDTKKGLQISAQFKGVGSGNHGFHIHENGSCDDGGLGAGGDFNPDGAPHGYLPTDGFTKARAGDLGNVEIGDNGKGKVELTVPGLTLTEGKYSVGGRAIILHVAEDDFTQPNGSAGGRIGCGKIEVTYTTD